jgi:mannose-6-phosphate isomerase-like protein (cupin superfamily)
LSIIVMGFRILPGANVKPTARLMIANTDDVPMQVLGNRPTTRYQLMMGTTESTRDKLAAGYTVTSLFIMDFMVGGTNNPHRHKTEEEVYFVLRGEGDMVAGETSDGKELRYPSKVGDAYFFPLNTLVGFYSKNKEGEEHAQVLAVRTVNLDM